MDGRDDGTGGFWPARTVSPSDTQPRSSQRHGLLYAAVRVVCSTHDDRSVPESAIAPAGNHSGADEVA
jgi:hypothetical protein